MNVYKFTYEITSRAATYYPDSLSVEAVDEEQALRKINNIKKTMEKDFYKGAKFSLVNKELLTTF